MATSFDESVLGPNLFPKNDPRHEYWVTACRRAAEEEARLRSKCLEGDPEELDVHLELTAGLFDIRAKYLLPFFLVGDYEGAELYKETLARISEVYLAGVQKYPPSLRRKGLTTEIKRLLAQRSAHWMAEALASARRIEAKAEGVAESVRSGTKTASDPAPDAPVPNLQTTAATRLQAPVAIVEAVPLSQSEESGLPEVVAAGASDNTFRRAGEGWTLVYGGAEAPEIPDLKGMAVIHSLLKNPSQPGSKPRRISSAQLDNPDAPSFVDHGQPAIEPDMMRKMARDKQELAAACVAASIRGDIESVTKLEKDLENLSTYERKSTDKRGRPRRLDSTADKARYRVRKNYVKALKHLQGVAPSFAQHLSDSIKKGHSWTYTPTVDPKWKT